MKAQSNFLDDKLYNHVKSTAINSVTDFQKLVNELYKLTEDHFKPQLRVDMTYVEGRKLMDRVFSSWDLCIKRLEKENWWMTDVLIHAHYKKVFLNDDALKKIYNKGK